METTRVRDIETGTGGRKRIGNKWKMMKSDQSVVIIAKQPN